MREKLLIEELTVNFIKENEQGVSTCTAIPASELPSLTNQSFVWTNQVIVDETNITPCCVIKMSDTDIESAKKRLKELYISRQLRPLTVVQFDNQIYYVTIEQVRVGKFNVQKTILNAIEETEENKDSLEKLNKAFASILANTPIVGNNSEFEPLLQEIFGTMLNPLYLNDTIDTAEFTRMMKDVQETHRKLGIKKINGTVGYGVVALEDIPANTALTFYAGKLSHDPDADPEDKYRFGVGADDSISADGFRNYSGFITHAFPKAPANHKKNDNNIVLESFESLDPNAVDWHDNIVSANVEGVEEEIYDHIPYLFFVNPEPIKAGSIIAFNYGPEYWQSLKICPALLTLKGEVIDPTTYVAPRLLRFGRSPSTDNVSSPHRFLAVNTNPVVEQPNDVDLSLDQIL